MKLTDEVHQQQQVLKTNQETINTISSQIVMLTQELTVATTEATTLWDQLSHSQAKEKVLSASLQKVEEAWTVQS